jgi:hypothetical protein
VAHIPINRLFGASLWIWKPLRVKSPTGESPWVFDDWNYEVVVLASGTAAGYEPIANGQFAVAPQTEIDALTFTGIKADWTWLKVLIPGSTAPNSHAMRRSVEYRLRATHKVTPGLIVVISLATVESA